MAEASGRVWYAWAHDDQSGTLAAYSSPEFPDGAVVAAASLARPAGQRPVIWQARFDPATGSLLQVVSVAGPGTLWYVAVPEPDDERPAVSLVAFDTTHFPPGTVVDNDTFRSVPVASTDQVGAIRWWPATGQIHQVYVSPMRRRQGIGTALVYAASAHLKASGSPRHLWSGGDRTDLGEALASALPHRQRVRPRRGVVPEMTPPDQREGVPHRNLFPDPG